jgi:hypothetical protein
MRFRFPLAFSLLTVVFSLPSAAQQSPAVSSPQAVQRDPQALAVLQKTLTAMGHPPMDSTASGNITTVAGSLTENGTITILTRGTDQTSEQIQTSTSFTRIYSRGHASTVTDGSASRLPMEVAVSGGCGYFPLPLIADAIANPDDSLAYLGLEPINGASAYHLQFWHAFAAIPELQPLSPLSLRDVWIDANSSLPLKLSLTRRSVSDSDVSVHVDVLFSNYQNVSGVLYPFSIQESLNGTPWLTISIQNVKLNSGLDDSSFPVSVKEGQ